MAEIYPLPKTADQEYAESPLKLCEVNRSFVSDLPAGKESLAIIRAVAGIGRALGITTTAEGVEAQSQLAAVIAEGFR
ncbi:EAL domain-containing protein [Ensifer aridi]|uniref:EAL domain-containing protein n=1 Tax=Ensifer aridi TaxID=1708715 RepID=UPI000411A660